jgi:hypothetical protein
VVVANESEIEAVKGRIRDLRDYAHGMRATHYHMGDTRARVHQMVGGAAIIVGAVASGGILKSVNSNPGYWLTLIAGGLTLLGTVLAGAQTFYKFGDIAESHRLAAANYGKSRDECDCLLIHLEGDGPFDAEAEREALCGLMKEIGDLDTSGPGINGRLYDRLFRRFSRNKRPPQNPRPE